METLIEGVVVPEKPLTMDDLSTELREEFELWERASDEAWLLFLQWKSQEERREAAGRGLSSFAGE